MQALLMTDTAIDGDQYVISAGHAVKQFAILQTSPAKGDR